jgi:alpha-N-arabinofuranosidase
VRLTVSFRRRNSPDTVLASTEVTVPGGGKWTKLPFQLRLPAGAVKSREMVDFSVAMTGDRRISLDMIRLYPADAVEGLFDPEVVKLAKDMNFSMLRWGGNFMSTYHWEDGIGSLDKRRTQLCRAWGDMEYNELGTDEFMLFCRLVGTQPMICLNLGSGTKEVARQWVEYVNGAPTTPQGARRAANGHRDPYPPTVWELGNELWGDDQMGWQTPTSNAARYLEFYSVLRKQAGPGATLIACGPGLDEHASLSSRFHPDFHHVEPHGRSQPHRRVGHPQAASPGLAQSAVLAVLALLPSRRGRGGRHRDPGSPL